MLWLFIELMLAATFGGFFIKGGAKSAREMGGIGKARFLGNVGD